MSNELAVAVGKTVYSYCRRHGCLVLDPLVLAYLRERTEADLAHHRALSPADVGELVRDRLKRMPNALA